MKRFAILGHPVSHSLSPLMHSTAFQALGLDYTYEAIDVEPEDLKETLGRLREEGYAGLNVTLPHKQEMIKHLDELEKDAEIIGAVNTVVIEQGKMVGLNTDMTGFSEWLLPHQSRLEGAAVLLLGAGGSARAVLAALMLRNKPAQVTVLNRTLENAEQLVASFRDLQPSIRLSAESLFDDTVQQFVGEASVIINTTSVGMKPYADASPLEEVAFDKKQMVMDLIYVPPETKLIETAAKAGATALSGVEMFLNQGAASFRRWTGKTMPLDLVRKAVLEKLQGD